jgi:ABC-type nickel/cobalt efflux system permease component RcnA
MSATTPALLAAAAGVGFGHAILPDHWAPLAVVARTRRYPLAKVARLSGLAGVAHVLISIILGGVVIVIGLGFRSTIQSAQDTVVGGLLILTGLGLAALELTGRGHRHGEHGHTHAHGGHEHAHAEHGHHTGDAPHEHPHGDPVHSPTRHTHGRARGLAALMVPFGAAASPDLTILPVFLAATTVGVATAVGSVAIFAAVTIATIVGLTVAATKGGYQVGGEWLERWGNAATAAVLAAIGTLILTGAI